MTFDFYYGKDVDSKDEIEYAFEEVMEKVEWEKIAEYMVKTYWVWGLEEGSSPSVEEMKEKVRNFKNRVLDNVETNSEWFVSSGGFEVGYQPNAVSCEKIRVYITFDWPQNNWERDSDEFFEDFL